MTVLELIEKLKGFDPDLPVCLEDWAEEHELPCEAGTVTLCEGPHMPYRSRWSRGPFVCLGVQE